MIICDCCGRDISAIGQDNMSESNEYALCEDCYKEMVAFYIEEGQKLEAEWAEDALRNSV